MSEVTGRVTRVVVDHERCVGSGLCVLTEPSLFTQSDEDGRVVLATGDTYGADGMAAREAAYLCPAKAITIIS